MKPEKYIEIFNCEVVPALGCTEPIAVALAAATSTDHLEEMPEKIEVFLSGNVMKNGVGVGIPGTGMVGLHIAAALGVTGGDASKELEVLNGVSKGAIEKAKKLVLEKKVFVTVKENVDKLFIEVICSKGENSARTLICGSHTNVVLAELNGSVIFQKTCGAFSKKDDNQLEEITEHHMTVEEIWNFINEVPLKEIEYVLKGAEMNRTIGLEGLTGDYGLRVGKTLRQNIVKGNLCDDLSNWVMALTAAASDARMAGSTLSVMSNSGSGNQGITAMLPVLAVSERLHCSREQLIRGLYLSNLIAIHLKEFMARLSALCGVVTAATGAACGITFLMGGNLQQINYTIKNMIGNISGMICDGAKAGCSLKVSTAISAALQSALLAIENIEVSEFDGIIEKDIEKTIKNLALVASEGMETTDKVILDIMSCK
ncbi:MAG TPA: serine dehydratase subunit alpha family protein [bacterium]|nr:serine dehydratase subunit alpha family protein [bacterium]